MKKYISIFLLIPLMACARPSSFSGTWSYTDQVEDTVGGKELVLKQEGNSVTGVWNEGISTGSGGSGKLKGYVKGNKLFLSYCSDEGNNWYESCPRYDSNESYFIIDNNKIIEFYKNNNKEYKKGKEFILIK
ncbi:MULTISPECIES: hypothetical protein [Neisseria]|mgnify:CR=1 FL=1|jgi:putative secreted protein|uniref:hypothetical protein n=1 Tax=Neisseria TaxID=482 RepID=UPI000A87E6D3|nr:MULTISPECIES: hypothetical protein [Neisseria]